MKTKPIEWVKKYGWIVLAIVLIIISIIFFWPKKPVVIQDNTVIVHRFDSLRYIKSNDSLKAVIGTLEKEIVKREASYTRMTAILNKKKDAVQTLPKTEVVEEFSNRVYVDVDLREDSNVIVPLQGIRNAVVLIYERDAALVGIDYFSDRDSLHLAMIEKQNELITAKDNRISVLTKEFYNSQNTISGLKTDLEKQQKKVRKRNTMLGIISGAGAVAILVAVLK